MRRSFSCLLALSALLMVTSVAHALVTPAQKCVAFKVDAAARAVVGHVSCQARAVEKNKPVRAGCHEGVDRRLLNAFARVEARGGCPFVGDAAQTEAAIDTLVDTLVGGATTGRCGATKLRAAARKAYSDLACYRVAARHGTGVSLSCQQGAVTHFLAAFARADERLACGTTGDATAVQTVVDAFVALTSSRLIEGGAVIGGSPGNFTATIEGASVELAWDPPALFSGKTHVRVLRRLNALPTDPNDVNATVVFFGTATTTSHPLTDLLPTTATTARTYQYAAYGCTAAGDCEPAGVGTTLAPTVGQALLGGGYTVYFRHASATVCTDQTGLGTAATTMSPDWWKSCDANCGTTATARQLDAAGVTQATTIGQGFDTRGFPVGRVIASEFCRTRTTAQLMDLGPAIETDQGITFFVYDEASRCASATTLLAQVPAAGGNTVIVGHAGFTCEVLGSLAMGEGAIFKPNGSGGSVFIASVLPDLWATLP